MKPRKKNAASTISISVDVSDVFRIGGAEGVKSVLDDLARFATSTHKTGVNISVSKSGRAKKPAAAAK